MHTTDMQIEQKEKMIERKALAAMAMQGLCANPITEEWSAKVIAGYCFVLADAMLKQATLSEKADD